MTVIVTGPDGAQHEFPDGTSPDVIRSAMARAYGPPAGASAPAASQPVSPETAPAAPQSPFSNLQQQGPLGTLAASTLAAVDATVEGGLDIARIFGGAADGVLNTPKFLVEQAAKAGLLKDGSTLPYPYFDSPGAVDRAKAGVDSTLQRVGVPDIDAQSLPDRERFLYDATRFTAPALATMGAAGAPKAVQALETASPAAAQAARGVAQSVAAKPVRSFANEAAAGLGVSAGNIVAEQNDIPLVPEAVERLVLPLFFAGGAGTANSAAFSGVDAIRGATGKNMIARALQAEASNPAQAASNIAEIKAAADELGVAAPNAFQASDDVGLLQADRGLRMKPDYARIAIENDRRARQGLSEAVTGLRDPNADPLAPKALAQERRQALTDTNRRAEFEATDKLDKAKTDAALPTFGEEVLSEQKALDPLGAAASAEADAVIKAELDARTGIRNEVREKLRASTDPVDVKYMLPKLREIVADANKAIDPKNRIPPGVIERFGAFLRSKKPTTIGQLEELRIELSEMKAQARKAGEFQKADNLQKLLGLINDAPDHTIMRVDPRAIPSAEGRITGPGMAEAVRKFEREEFLPYFGRESAGGKYRKAVQRDNDRVDTPPGATLGRFFLKSGGGAKQAAEDLKKIVDLSPDAEKGQDAVRRYLLSSAAASVKNDRVDPKILRTWIDRHSEALAAYPAVRGEIERVLSDALAKRTRDEKAVTDAQRIMRETAAQSQLSEQEFQRSAARIFLDKSPKKAVASVFGAEDPVRAMDDAIKLVKGNADAEAGLKAAIAEFMADRVTNNQVALTSEGADPISFVKLKKFMKENRNTLAKVYSEKEIDTLDNVQTLLEAMTRETVRATSGSSTVENAQLAAMTPDLRWMELWLRVKYGHLKGGGAMRSINLTINRGLSLIGQDPDKRLAAFRKLVAETATDPQKAILALNYKDTPAFNERLTRLYGLAQAQDYGAEDDSEDDED